MLGAVQGALAELREEDAPPESIHDHGSVLYFVIPPVADGRRGGSRATKNVARPVVRGRRDDRAQAPSRCGPTNLPAERDTSNCLSISSGSRRRATARPSRWMASSGSATPTARATWPSSPGCAATAPASPSCPSPLNLSTPCPGWAAGPAREGGGDFETSLPGAELDGLIGIRTPAEVFKLAALLLRRVVLERSGRLRRRRHAPLSPQSAHDASTVSAGPTPSALPYVTL